VDILNYLVNKFISSKLIARYSLSTFLPISYNRYSPIKLKKIFYVENKNLKLLNLKKEFYYKNFKIILLMILFKFMLI